MWIKLPDCNRAIKLAPSLSEACGGKGQYAPAIADLLSVANVNPSCDGWYYARSYRCLRHSGSVVFSTSILIFLPSTLVLAGTLVSLGVWSSHL